MNSGAIKHYEVLTRSPLLLSQIVEAFFVESRPTDKNILLGYLVLPMVMNKSSLKFLVNAKSTSSLRTFLQDRERVQGIRQRLADSRGITNAALANSIACGRLQVGSNMSVVKGDVEVVENGVFKREIRAAKSLAQIFGPYDVPTIYRWLGITNL